MNTPGNREAGDRNLSTADLAAAGRKASVHRDDELDDVAAARTAGDRSGAPRTGGERAAALRTVGEASMGDRAAAERKGEATSSAAEPGDTPTTGQPAAAKPATDRGAEQLEPLFSSKVAGDYRDRWAAVQSSFVDDPRRAVREGDELVAQVMKSLAESFAAERGRLETQLGQTGEATTEALRVSLRRYRSFFERLLSL